MKCFYTYTLLIVEYVSQINNHVWLQFSNHIGYKTATLDGIVYLRSKAIGIHLIPRAKGPKFPKMCVGVRKYFQLLLTLSATLIYSELSSKPIPDIPNSLQAIRVDPIPTKGSKTTSPGFVLASLIHGFFKSS